MAKNDNVYIYLLRDPMTDEVCYVGQTRNPTMRCKQHRKKRGLFSGNYALRQWKGYLIITGVDPIFEVLEIVPMDKALEAEKQHILQCLNKGEPLLNLCGTNMKRTGVLERMRNSEWHQIFRTRGKNELSTRNRPKVARPRNSDHSNTGTRQAARS